MEVLPAEFARQAGVTRQSIFAKIKKGTLIQNSAGKLDTENPVNAGYLSAKRRRLEEIQATTNTIIAKQKNDIQASPLFCIKTFPIRLRQVLWVCRRNY